MIDTNIKGLLYLTRFVVPEWSVEVGVVNLGSTAGHQTYPRRQCLQAAVRVISEGLKQDLWEHRCVLVLDPGLVETEFSNVRFRGDTERAKQVYQGLTPLTPADVADVVFCVTDRISASSAHAN